MNKPHVVPGADVGVCQKIETTEGPTWSRKLPRPSTQNLAIRHATEVYARVSDGDAMHSVRITKKAGLKLLKEGSWTLWVEAWTEDYRIVEFVAPGHYAREEVEFIFSEDVP